MSKFKVLGMRWAMSATYLNLLFDLLVCEMKLLPLPHDESDGKRTLSFLAINYELK